MLKQLKQEVLEANIELQQKGLVIYTWGNVSGISRQDNLVVIKPSGVAYKDLTLESMVVVDLEGRIVEGDLKPSSDTPTHLELYREFTEIGGVVHTHSPWATSWAQACKPIPCFGTTHADYFYKDIPCTRALYSEEIKEDYEENTGKVIVETFTNRNYSNTSAVLVAGHGPFTWGTDPHNAVHNSVVLEELARMGLNTLLLDSNTSPISRELMDKHYWRKHGNNAYYGQN